MRTKRQHMLRPYADGPAALPHPNVRWSDPPFIQGDMKVEIDFSLVYWNPARSLSRVPMRWWTTWRTISVNAWYTAVAGWTVASVSLVLTSWQTICRTNMWAQVGVSIAATGKSATVKARYLRNDKKWCDIFKHTLVRKFLPHSVQCGRLIKMTGDKPYQCTVCKKRFSEANIMTQHMRRHTGERPYKCSEKGCDREFSISGALTIHRRVHSGEKPFSCKYQDCGKRFAESSNLTKHVRRKTPLQAVLMRLLPCRHVYTQAKSVLFVFHSSRVANPFPDQIKSVGIWRPIKMTRAGCLIPKSSKTMNIFFSFAFNF